MEIWNHVVVLLAWKSFIFFANDFLKLLLNYKIQDFSNLNCFSFGIMWPMSREILCRCTYIFQNIYAILQQRSYNFPYRIGAQNHKQLFIVLQFICDKYSKWPARSVLVSFGCDNRTTSQKIAITQNGPEEFIQPVQIICRIYFIFERKWYFSRFVMKFCCCYRCCFRIVQLSSPNKSYFFKCFSLYFLWSVQCHWPFSYFVR